MGLLSARQCPAPASPSASSERSERLGSRCGYLTGTRLPPVARFTSEVLLQASLFSVVTTLILALRWAILTESPRDRYGARGFHDALVGQIFNLITPAAVGADAYRSW